MEYHLKLWHLVTGGLVIFYAGMFVGIITVVLFSVTGDNNE
jgi:hypothetical protein